METQKKTCTKCNIEKNISQFCKRSGRHKPEPSCLQCVREYSRKYRATEGGKAKRKLYQINYRKTENGKNAGIKYRKSDKGKITSKSIKTKYRSQEKNRQIEKAYARDYYHHVLSRIPKKHLDINISNSIRKALKGNKKRNSWEKLVGYTLDDLFNHLKNQFVGDMSWDNYGSWHIDHVKPKSLFEYKTAEDMEFKKCWALSNLQPLWAGDNIRKSNKYVHGVDY